MPNEESRPCRERDDPEDAATRMSLSVHQIESTARNRQNCNNLLFEAAERGDAQGVGAAVRFGARPQWRNPACNGCTALHVAARGGHVDTIKLLVSVGADVAAANLQRETPLHESAGSGAHLAVLQLISCGTATPRAYTRVRAANAPASMPDLRDNFQSHSAPRSRPQQPEQARLLPAARRSR